MSTPSQQLEQQIQQILTGDNDSRKQSEQQLKQFCDQNPDQFIVILLELLFTSQFKIIREFCSVSLRKHLSEFSEQSYTNIWKKLQPATKQLFKEKIIVALQNEPEKEVKRKLADTIGEVGASIIQNGCQNEWSELISIIWQLLSNNDMNVVESGLKVLSTVLMYEVDCFEGKQKELLVVFQSGLNNSNKEIQLATADAISSYMENIDFTQIKNYEQLAGPLVSCMLNMMKIDADKAEELLENIGEICESAPSFFKKDSQIFYDSMYQITFNKQLEGHIRRLSTENALLLAERIPKLIKTNKELLSKILEMIISHMVEISSEIEAEWEKPKEGFSEDIEEDAEYESVRFGTNGIDRLISSIGSETMLPLISSIVQKMLEQSDWRYIHAAIMALSQVGEYIDNIDEIRPIIQLVVTYANNANSKIRYAVCHCIGQIADDVEEFGDKYCESLFPQLFTLLEDSVPRVQSHAAAAITNFVEQMDEDVIKPYLQTILERLIKLLQNSISIVKETVLAAISATSEACKASLTPYYSQLMELLFNMMQTHQANEYKQLRGQIIESITLMSHSVGKEQFINYQDKVIEMMLQLQESGISQGTDPQKSYLLSGWQRIALTIGKDFSSYLPRVIPSIANMIQKLLQEGQGELEGAVSINTNQTEELEVAVNMLGVIVDEIGEGMGQWLEQVFLLLINLVNFQGNESVRVSAMKGLEGCIEASPANAKQQVGNQILTAIFQCIDKEYSTGVLEEAIYTVKETLENLPQYSFSQQEINEIVKCAMKVLMESDKRKGQNEESLHGAELDEDQKEVFEEEQDGESELQLAIAQLFGTIFKQYKDYTLELVETLYNQILPKVLVDTVTVKTQQFGLYVVDDLLEHLGPSKLQNKLEVLSNILEKYSTHPHAGCRQAACYGIGLFVGYKEIVNQELVQKYLIKLNDALKIKKDSEREYGHAKDNTVSALGKIIKNHSEKININECIQLWLNNLPLKNDKIEAKGMHQLLTEIIEANSVVVFGQNNENLPKVIKIFGEIIGTKYINEETKKKIAQILSALKTNQFVIQNWNEIVGKLSAVQQKRLQDCINQQ